MRFLGTLLVFAGYVFVYASVAAGGKFATEPWAGLFADAYTGAPVIGNTSQITNQQLTKVARSRGITGPIAPLTPAPPPGTTFGQVGTLPSFHQG